MLWIICGIGETAWRLVTKTIKPQVLWLVPSVVKWIFVSVEKIREWSLSLLAV